MTNNTSVVDNQTGPSAALVREPPRSASHVRRAGSTAAGTEQKAKRHKKTPRRQIKEQMNLIHFTDRDSGRKNRTEGVSERSFGRTVSTGCHCQVVPINHTHGHG